MNYDSKKKFFGSFFCLLSSINHDYSWHYLLYITHKGSNNSYLQSFKKICVVWNNWLFLNYISYNWNLTYKKSISLPQVLEINKNYWTGSDGSTIEPLNRGLNSYHALLKIYLPIHFNFLSWTWIQVYIIATFWLDAIPIPFFSILYFSCSRILVSKWWPFPLQSCCLHAS